MEFLERRALETPLFYEEMKRVGKDFVLLYIGIYDQHWVFIFLQIINFKYEVF